jgi:predicted AlkP superfamily phosphohydrolase/phosphomutase
VVGDDVLQESWTAWSLRVRNRADHSYDRYSIANSLAIKEDRLWDILSRNGKRSEDISHPAES